MALAETPALWDELPDEILLHIINNLEPHHIVTLQLVSRKLRKLCLDNETWKRCCFEKSPWYQSLEAGRTTSGDSSRHGQLGQDAGEPGSSSSSSSTTPATDRAAGRGSRGRDGRRTRAQDMANWDPAFPQERVSWYEEYIQRRARACVNWLEHPRVRDRGPEPPIEARGVALYSPYQGNDGLGTMMAVSPLDDGSVCLWDIKGSRGRQGRIVATSKSDILFTDGPNGQNNKRSKTIDTGVTDCVSVHSSSHRAFFAVQSHLIEVDLHRLEVASRESFGGSITTLSAAHDGVPLTVGTSHGVHLHDFRARARVPHDVVERLDGSQWDETDVVKGIFDTKPPPPYASLSEPTPLSILHLPEPGSQELVSNHIYVAGRFTNILHYDRRKFPAMVRAIWSGGLVKSLASLPYPFSTRDNEARRRAEVPLEQIAQMKAQGTGSTLIAGGEYKSKGSLELHGLGDDCSPQGPPTQNRQTAASSTILSVANHGTKIVFADGTGNLKWFERDGYTQCRQIKIGSSDDAKDPSSMHALTSSSDEMARKIISTHPTQTCQRSNDDYILFWTGERLGMVSFTTRPLFSREDFEAQSPEPTAEEKERSKYDQEVRLALRLQANEVSFLGGMTRRG